jgi:hypothetical protein
MLPNEIKPVNSKARISDYVCLAQNVAFPLATAFLILLYFCLHSYVISDAPSNILLWTARMYCLPCSLGALVFHSSCSQLCHLNCLATLQCSVTLFWLPLAPSVSYSQALPIQSVGCTEMCSNRGNFYTGNNF